MYHPAKSDEIFLEVGTPTAFVNEFVFTRLTFSKLSFQHICQKRRAPTLCYSLEKRGWVYPGGILGAAAAGA